MILTICFLLMLNFCGNLGHHGNEKPNKKFEPRIIGGQIAANRKFFLAKTFIYFEKKKNYITTSKKSS